MITRSESNSNGGPRHSMRAAVEHLNRRAEDCPPYRVLARARFSYENRTSLPGSISKSSPSESSVFGLITSSMNFT